ncbi:MULTISPECIES: helix-turn-helix transcriptional regulator [unclassified Streptomyces]|uniref:helix-turn-helix transcriptional regulator n=1 Tax=unclassified Streptomyces TaxID=2593676 RepID=UPI002E16D615|nr:MULTISPECIES: helix-turn-helix transcriptional regulator [unclassified Streptomyces]
MASQQDAGSELGRFLRARRNQTTPDDVGLAVGPGVRRTPGLRREELATLAGVSIDYYTRLERGKETRPSPGVLDALARALKLNDEEHQHLRSLAIGAAHFGLATPGTPDRAVQAQTRLVVESLRPHPAYVIGRNLDLLVANPSTLALCAGIAEWPPEQRNIVRYLFAHPASREIFADWDNQAISGVARLRAVTATEPDASDVSALAEELKAESPYFRELWESYEVKGRRMDGQKTFRHPRVGTLTLSYQSLFIEGSPGQRLGIFTAEPGTPEYEAIVQLDGAAVDSTD